MRSGAAAFTATRCARAAAAAIFLLTPWVGPAAFADEAGNSASDISSFSFQPLRDARARLESAGISFDVFEQSEVWGNVVGGMRTGADYNGLTTVSLTLDLEKIAGWKGAKIFADTYQIHGIGPSTSLVGNQQLISNIEATPSTKLYMLWLEQQLFDDAINIRIGQEGANDEMMLAPSAALFLNSSFGYPDLLAQNLPSGGPNYPLATPMARVQIKASSELTLVGAIFNGDPAGPGPGDPQLRDASGTAFRLQDPPLMFGEIWYTTGQDKNSFTLPAVYKIGAWYHAGSFESPSRDSSGLSLANPLSNGIAARFRGDYAIYGIVDQTLWSPAGAPDRGLSLFILGMVAPDDRNRESAFVEGGINWKGPFSSRPKDVLGLAVAYARTSPSLIALGREQVGPGFSFAPAETVYEATYNYEVSERLSLQPDLQIVQNPGAALGSETPPLKNSLTLGLRTKIDF
jgi:porin